MYRATTRDKLWLKIRKLMPKFSLGKLSKHLEGRGLITAMLDQNVNQKLD